MVGGGWSAPARKYGGSELETTLQVIDPQGQLVGEDPGLDAELYQRMYRNMVLSRELDRRMLALQRQGRIGTYAMLEGQEAVQIGSALALDPDDFVFPSYREHGVQVTRGLPIEVLLAYWKGLPNGRWDMEKYRTGIVYRPHRQPAPPRRRLLVRHQAEGREHRHRRLFRGRGDLGSRLPLGHELRRGLEDPDRLHLRQQPLRDLGAVREADGIGDHRPEGRWPTVSRDPGRRDGRRCHVPGHTGGRRPSAKRAMVRPLSRR